MKKEINLSEIMGAADNLLYEYAVIRYVPRVDREEFVNIGLIMMNKRNKWLKAKIMVDPRRLKALFPNADLECLQKQTRLFEMEDVPAAGVPVEEKYRWLSAVKSACIQVSPSHPGIVENQDENAEAGDISEIMDREFLRLYSSLVL